MYACKQCSTGNPLDSSFCKKCGGPLSEVDIKEAQLKLDSMIEEGNNYFTQGRTEEAMMIAEAAVLANPSSHTALSLKGLCHEREGQIAEALECYEAAVALHPDSSLDKIKVNALRNRLAQRVTEVAPPPRKTALVAAGLTSLLVIVGGAILAVSLAAKQPVPMLASKDQSSSVPGFQDIQTPATAPQTQSNQVQQTQPQTGSENTNQASPNTNYRPITSLPTVPQGGILPLSSEMGGNIGLDGGNSTTGLQPFKAPTPPASTTSSDPAPAVIVEKSPAPAPKPEDRGIIDIKVAGPARNVYQPGAQPADSGNGLAAMAKTASSQYQLGRFDAAAQSYERLVRMGGDSGRVEQRLSQCYEKLGNTPQAIGALNKAIRSYQSSIKSGQDLSESQAGLDACTQALKVIGGN